MLCTSTSTSTTYSYPTCKPIEYLVKPETFLIRNEFLEAAFIIEDSNHVIYYKLKAALITNAASKKEKKLWSN